MQHRLTSRTWRVATVCWLAMAAVLPLRLFAQQGDSTAEAIVARAVHQAQIDHKNVLVKFGASWCGWCHRFDRFLESPEPAGRLMRDNFVIVPLTVMEVKDKKALETPGGNELIAAVGGKDAGLPFFYFLDQRGAKIGDSNIVPATGSMGANVGHTDTPQEVAAFVTLLARVAPRMTVADRESVGRFLTAMHAGAAAATP